MNYPAEIWMQLLELATLNHHSSLLGAPSRPQEETWSWGRRGWSCWGSGPVKSEEETQKGPVDSLLSSRDHRPSEKYTLLRIQGRPR